MTAGGRLASLAGNLNGLDLFPNENLVSASPVEIPPVPEYPSWARGSQTLDGFYGRMMKPVEVTSSKANAFFVILLAAFFLIMALA